MSRTSRNEPLNKELVDAIKPGMTAAKVVQLLGAPSIVVRLDGKSAYHYQHSSSKTGGLFLLVLNVANTDERSDRVWIFFDKDQKVTHVGKTFSADRAEFALPWEDIYDELVYPQLSDLEKSRR